MARKLTVAAAQVGAINRDTPRKEVMTRLLSLLDQAAAQKVQLLVYPECTFTTFFPRHLIEPGDDLESFFEETNDSATDLDSVARGPDTSALFGRAVEHGIDIVVGFAERCVSEDENKGKGYNTSVYFCASENRVIAKYRKVHLPGTVEPFTEPDAVNQLEKRYFTPGDLGFKAFRAPGLLGRTATADEGSGVWRKGTPGVPEGEISRRKDQGKGDPVLGMLICNDRRWPEAWRVYALQGAELIVFGYNTGANLPALWGSRKPLTPAQAEAQALHHHTLVQTSSSYTNSLFSISAARCGRDDADARYDLIAGSMIVNPQGYVVAEAQTKGDEIVVARIDLEECRQGREKTFDFERHRRVEHYELLVQRTGCVEPPLL
ncbi:hypothetical protein AAFC00_006783 [Neodothiora populina]|uniref:CN hydrolase domain-containing protein n=1 Tax=Neodothiora populina TaxID=2781224 RepID=A0ABR3PB50_9PEZI